MVSDNIIEKYGFDLIYLTSDKMEVSYNNKLNCFQIEKLSNDEYKNFTHFLKVKMGNININNEKAPCIQELFIEIMKDYNPDLTNIHNMNLQLIIENQDLILSTAKEVYNYTADKLDQKQAEQLSSLFRNVDKKYLSRLYFKTYYKLLIEKEI